MLVLLAIVLTTATFIVEGRLQIRLPVSESQAEARPRERVEIAIDAAGGLFIGSEALGSGAAGLDALEPHLEALAHDTPSSCGGCGTRFEGFVAVVDRLKARGLDRLTILTASRD